MRAASLVGACVVALLGCKSALEKCREAQANAAHAWGAYADAVETDVKAARKTQAEAQAKLTAMQKRLTADAEKVADARYARSDDAWMRTYEIARDTACRKDADCETTRRDNEAAKTREGELQPRLNAARAAEKAAPGDPAGARAAVEAIETDYEYPAMKVARSASAEADERCQGVTLPDE